MPLDPNIILGIGDLNDPRKRQQIQANQLALMDAQRKEQAQNTLRQLMSQPGAIDQQGMISPNTLSKVAQVDYGTYADLADKQLNLQQDRIKLYAEYGSMLEDKKTPAAVAYEDTLASTGSKDAAQAAGQAAWDEGRQELVSSGQLPGEIQDKLPTKFDPVKFELGSKQFAEWRKQNLQERTEREKERHDEAMEADTRRGQDIHIDTAGQAKWAVMTDPDTNTTIRYNPETAQATDMAGKPIPVPKGLARLSTGAGAGGSRAAIMNSRILIDASDAVSDLYNISRLPITTSSGFLGLGGRAQGQSLLGATKEMLVNEVSSQEVQDANTTMVGLGRAVAGLETGGLQVNEYLMKQFEKLQLVPGDTYLTKLRKLATFRQNVNNALEAQETSPTMGPKQVDLAKKLQEKLTDAIPYTVDDVRKLEYGPKTKSISDYAKERGLEKNAPVPGSPFGAPPTSLLKKGVHTKFVGKGTWTLGDDGQPQQVSP